MPAFSGRSRSRLSECHPDLQAVFNRVIKEVDCIVIEGHRNEDRQEKLFKEGKTKAHYGQSKHNSNPSLAIDIVPYPVDWNDRERFTLFAGYVLGISKSMGVSLRWGGNWSRDFNPKLNSFDDLPHF